MIPNEYYRIKARLKLHTSPLKILEYEKEGKFIRETDRFYVFDEFMVKKLNVISITHLKRG